MWFTRAALRANRIALPAVAATGWIASTSNHKDRMVTLCEDQNKIRKRTTLAKANCRTDMRIRRSCTRDQLAKLRGAQDEIFQRWERDEDGWRELPARAWPPFQPDPGQLVGIQLQVQKNGCDNDNNNSSDLCQSLLFNVATALVFHNVDPPAGLQQYEQLAANGHVDSMVACGVILTEGLGGLSGREEEGVEWLRKAVARGSTQALYELGTLYYTGLQGVVWEDPEGAYQLFEQAASKGHVGATYMMADCLIEAEGVERDVARAIPLLYQAADNGHRYARQRVRELLNRKNSKFQS